MRYEIRAATRADRDDLLRLSEHLDSVNLPHDAAEIDAIVEASEGSFDGRLEERARRYVFVLRDLEERRAVGTSMVIAQLGSRDYPYVFFDVHDEERYSATLDKHFVHRVLTMGYSYHGPTEIGGLVVHPDARRAPERLGMLISYARFLFIAACRERFQPRVLAELLPPLEPDGTSRLWEAVGRHFTGLTYREADRLSKKNKEFIRGLFPNGDIYVSLLPTSAQEVIGQVGPQTRGVAKMLTRIGFRYVDRVDPFDGGPHFMAATDEIELVQRARRSPLVAGDPAHLAESARACLVARIIDEPPYFRAVPGRARVAPGEDLLVDPATLTHLELADGEPGWVLPLY
ncbi:MAG: arginine N-succinyltransferase [Sandaracinaceae bacterium]|nr:arginine N-succinyltransferase [Sandaracinaceae bacterium]